MFQILEGSQGNVIGVEVSESYTKQDVEALKKLFEAKLAEGFDRINLLCKIDNLKLRDIKFDAFIEDAAYALKYIEQLRHIAVVGNSDLIKHLVKWTTSYSAAGAKSAWRSISTSPIWTKPGSLCEARTAAYL